MKLFIDSIHSYTGEAGYNRAMEDLQAAGLTCRIDKILRKKADKVRLLELAASCTLMRAFTEARITDPVIHEGEFGKPYLSDCRMGSDVNELNRPMPEFNLSHSGEYAVCAITDPEKESGIGADIQNITTDREGIAKRFFSKAESEWLSRIPVSAKDVAFTRLWTLKEAYIKLTGEGLSRDLGSFSIIPGSKGVNLYDPSSTCADNVGFTEISFPGYHVSVCVCLNNDNLHYPQKSAIVYI